MEAQMKLSESYKVPDSVLGYLEWCSGILCINATYEEFKLVTDINSPTPVRLRHIAQTISHETYHFAQAVTTGFFFQFACQALNCVSTILGSPLDANRVRRILASPPQMSDDYADLIATLDEHSGDYLTNRAVIESSTMFFEHREHYRELNHESYLQLLRNEVPSEVSEYRVCYELATNFLGSRAFDSILPISFIALCFAKPRNVFRAALSLIQSEGIPAEWTVSIVQQVAQSLKHMHQPIGSAIEGMETGLSHHVYSPVVLLLN